MTVQTLPEARDIRTVVTAAIAALCFMLAALAHAGTPRISDQEISDAVEDEILLDAAVSLNDIDVSVSDGVVTMKGDVNSILAKERAAKIACIVKGVRSVVNNVEVDPPVDRTDPVVEEEVEDALLYDPATESYEVDVSVADGVVTMAGAVESWQERALAAKVVKNVRGVTGVNNNLDVEYETDRSDLEIQTEIEKALQWDTLVDHALIDVSVNDGKVKLSGTVGSAAEKTEATIDAWVAGVESVKADKLEVARWARDEDLREDKYVDKPDSQIRAAVEDALLYDPRVASFEMKTEVNNGVATLRGEVDNLKAKRAAANDARNTVGVLRVENRLKVRPGLDIADTTVKQQVMDSFERDPFVESPEVTVSVVDGTAYLYGEVDSYYEKAQADDAASRVAGVVEVNNNLEVGEDYDPYHYDPYVDDWYWYDYDWYDYDPGYTWESDEEIREEIHSEYFWSPFVDGGDINVSVEAGKAKLTGEVDSWSERQSATENAFEGGAVAVDNDLVVQ